MSFDEGEKLLTPRGGKPSSGGGEALPETTRVQMEQAFGTDFRTVRVHVAGESDALGAEAYAQGEHLFFATGRYAPGTKAGDELIGHELAHVVQQRSGRVAEGPQGKGAVINQDRGLEGEADRAGMKAARGEAAGIAGGGGPAASGAEAPIQGNFGFELEVDAGTHWYVDWAKQGGTMPRRGTKEDGKDYQPKEKTELPPKAFAIATGSGLQLQAEDCGTDQRSWEMVSNAPGLTNRGAVEKAASAASDLGTRLESHIGKGPFNAREIGGTPAIKLTPGTAVRTMLQVTAGVPLACIPALIEAMDNTKSDNLGGSGNEKRVLENAKGSKGDLDQLVDGKASAELQGFLTLLRQYISYLRDGKTREGIARKRNLLKGQLYLMARTDFKTMFGMLPQNEQTILKTKMDQWITIVCQGVEKTEQLTESVYNYDQTWAEEGLGITTTREQWLRAMPDNDRFSKHGHQVDDPRLAFGSGGESAKTEKDITLEPLDIERSESMQKKIEALYEGTSGYGEKHDQVQYLDQHTTTGAGVFELRGLPEFTNPQQIKPGIMKVYDRVADVIQQRSGLEEGSPMPFKQVLDDRQEGVKKESKAIKQQIKVERLQDQIQEMIAAAQKSNGRYTLNHSGVDRSRAENTGPKGLFKNFRKKKQEEKFRKKLAKVEEREKQKRDDPFEDDV